ncbi:MAG TPA: fumarylacetoacetate hydrolase family protein [Gemmataceae bacterium]|jgi:2-keto-4-pentenoate hydratase/2-oxohepta-3-ene-1,7-dioic acid hydratase in catechol pathway|nr:fumarylacetoacetate hydrolase family protein [Gemmataceae bacterium]
MRLATLATPAGPRAAVGVGNYYVDLYATDPSLPSSVRSLLAGGPGALREAAAADRSPRAVRVAAGQVELLPPVPDPPKILCIGLNYRDHAKENNRAIPTEPVLFAKFHNTLIGPDDPIRLPNVSQKVDYEAELVVVIGKRGRDIPKARAMEHVAGYTIGHDVSARDWQFKGEEKQWVVGKTFDTFAPTGPHLITADEVPDPHKLDIKLRLNGEVMQDSNTREFIFQIPDLIAYLSQVVTLEPGDLIFTGTPPGVGVARKPPVFLKPGDVAEVEIEGLGVLRNPVIAR